MFNAYTGSGTASNAGVFIPLADLPGLTQSELATTGSTLEGHLIYAVLNALYLSMSPMTILGIVNLSKSQPTGNATGRFSESIGFAYQRLLNYKTGAISAIPLAISGSEAGMGTVTIEDIFPSGEIVAQGGSIPGAGVVVPNSLIADYGAGILNNAGSDARSWVGAIMSAMAAVATVRSTTVESAVTSRTLVSAIRSTGVAIPANWYDPSNPLTNISVSDLGWLRVIQDQVTIEYELTIDPDNQTVSLSVRTA